jgi:hypothetical protein
MISDESFLLFHLNYFDFLNKFGNIRVFAESLLSPFLKSMTPAALSLIQVRKLTLMVKLKPARSWIFQW